MASALLQSNGPPDARQLTGAFPVPAILAAAVLVPALDPEQSSPGQPCQSQQWSGGALPAHLQDNKNHHNMQHGGQQSCSDTLVAYSALGMSFCTSLAALVSDC